VGIRNVSSSTQTVTVDWTDQNGAELSSDFQGGSFQIAPGHFSFDFHANSTGTSQSVMADVEAQTSELVVQGTSSDGEDDGPGDFVLVGPQGTEYEALDTSIAAADSAQATAAALSAQLGTVAVSLSSVSTKVDNLSQTLAGISAVDDELKADVTTILHKVVKVLKKV
jgi:flagellin-like hook-associated protein FlgL